MEKEMKIIEEELKEIRQFEQGAEVADVLSFSESCGGYLTIICC